MSLKTRFFEYALVVCQKKLYNNLWQNIDVPIKCFRKIFPVLRFKRGREKKKTKNGGFNWLSNNKGHMTKC